MSDSILFPPNYQSLSCNVIGNVVDHPRQTSHRAMTATNMLTARVPSREESNDNSKTVTTNAIKETRSTRDTIRGPRGTTRINVKALAARGLDVAELVRDAVARHRESRRVNQMRYRQKQLKKTMNLGTEVEKLREEVQQLGLLRVALSVSTNTNVWGFVAEYFRLFRHGLKPISTLPSNQAVVPLNAFDCHVQRSFLLKTMAPDVISPTGYGVEEILKSWALLARYHDNFHARLERIEKGAEDTVVASVKARVTISENTLRFAFPHLVNSRLGLKLLGRKLELRGYHYFDWDSSKNRVVSVHHSIDMLTPVMQLLGSLEDASRVFHKALITPDCSLLSFEVVQPSYM